MFLGFASRPLRLVVVFTFLLWGALFQLLVQDTTSAGFRPTQLGHPVEDVTPDRNFSPLCFAVPRLQSASEHGLVSEEAVFNARLLSVARLLLPLSSPALANPLKSRVTLRPWAVRWPRRHRRATRGNHNHDVLCTGRAELIVD